MPEILREADLKDREAFMAKARSVYESGGLVIFPTETVYGVGALATHDAGLERLRVLKSRTDGKPFSLHMPDVDMIPYYFDINSDDRVMRIGQRTMPGPITLIARVDDAFQGEAMKRIGLPPEEASRLYSGNTIGLRVVDHAVGSPGLKAAGGPVVASSANLAGEPAPTTFEMAMESIGDRVALAIDGGDCRYSAASTIVLLDGPMKVIRSGIYDEPYLKKLLRKKMLFICSGNTCRSPMAEAIAVHALQKAGVEDWEVASAGTFAGEGAPQAMEGVAALAHLGVPVQPHRSQPLTPALLRDVDVVFGMTRNHLAGALALDPSAESKLSLLDTEGDIEDPIGQGAAVYVRCAERIQSSIEAQLRERGLS